MSVPNLSPRAQQVLALARKEAERLNHNYVGTEHLLFGLLRLGEGGAVNIVNKLGVDLATIRIELERHVGSGPETKMVPNVPYTPRFKRVLAFAIKEAESPDHSSVGTKYFLLGLLRDGGNVAARVLNSLGVDEERARNELPKKTRLSNDESCSNRMLCQRCNEREATVFNYYGDSAMPPRHLCVKCNAIENPPVSHKCGYCAKKVMNAPVCNLCRREMLRFLRSKGFGPPFGKLTPERMTQMKSIQAELEQHMKDWVAKRKRGPGK